MTAQNALIYLRDVLTTVKGDAEFIGAALYNIMMFTL